MEAINKPGWKFTVYKDGDDLVCNKVRATAFGGFEDDGDNGQTASGMPTKQTPEPFGCALPILPQVSSTANSPFPRIPWGITVRVECGSRVIYCPVIDNGPAKSTGNAIDLTVASAKLINPNASANSFEAIVSFRVFGGAKFLK